jgi:methionyl-tRNA formyltransferase
MTLMNVVLFAWCPTSVLYLEALAAAGHAPCLAVTGARTAAGAPLVAACERLGVPLERRDDVNAPGFIARLRDLAVDLLLVAGCARILGPELCAAPRLGAINFHPSRLPDYRGREPLFWALLRGEPTVAVTAHRITAEVDAGPILFQREIAVPPGATSASLAPLVDRAGAGLVPEILAHAAAGALSEGFRSPEPGSHFPPLRAEHGLLDFTRSAVEIDRLVRAAQGEIAAYTFHRGFRVVVLEGEPGGEAVAGAAPGSIAAIEGGALGIAAARGVYRARRFLFLNRVHDGPTLAAALGIEVGAAFSANPAF